MCHNIHRLTLTIATLLAAITAFDRFQPRFTDLIVSLFSGGYRILRYFLCFQPRTRMIGLEFSRKITNCSEDFLHKLSRRIVNENQVIVVENLNVKGMMQNHTLAKSIHQVGWGMFCTMLKYKVEMEGKIYQEVDKSFPSSKTCHVCLNRASSLPLDIRFWICEQCHTKHNRDINAAINLRDEGLRILTSGTGDKACRLDVSRSSRGRKKSTTTLFVGQEAHTDLTVQCG